MAFKYLQMATFVFAPAALASWINFSVAAACATACALRVAMLEARAAALSGIRRHPGGAARVALATCARFRPLGRQRREHSKPLQSAATTHNHPPESLQ